MIYRFAYCAAIFSYLAACSLIGFSTAASSRPASRDHLTEKEADLIRDAQALDERTAIFIKAAERRLLALKASPGATSKSNAKEIEKWGEIPPSSRAELLSDVAKILDEAINNIDDVSARDAKNPLVPKALRKLAEASARFVAQLKPMVDQAEGQDEHEALAQALENAQAVIDAAGRLPAAGSKPTRAEVAPH